MFKSKRKHINQRLLNSFNSQPLFTPKRNLTLNFHNCNSHSLALSEQPSISTDNQDIAIKSSIAELNIKAFNQQPHQSPIKKRVFFSVNAKTHIETSNEKISLKNICTSNQNIVHWCGGGKTEKQTSVLKKVSIANLSKKMKNEKMGCFQFSQQFC